MARLIIVVSYFSSTAGFSPSEWLNDKLKCSKELGQNILLVTSMTENKGITFPENVTVIRVPSLSWRDYKYELDYTKQEGKLRPWHLFAFPLATTLGRLFDFTFRLLAGSHSDGKWSWAITSFPTLIFIHLLNRNAPIFATGGPSVAQLVSATIGRLFRARITLEFQDPFLGAEMKLPQRTLAALKKWSAI